MNYRKTLRISSVILIVLTCIYIFVQLYDNSTKPNETEIYPINDINVKDIAAIAISNEDAKFGLLVGENGVSLESENKDGSYSEQEMQAFIYTISKLTGFRELDDYDNLSQYGLSQPVCQITIILTDGSKIRLFLGSQNSVDESFYLYREGVEKVYSIETSLGELMLRNESDFKNKMLLPDITAADIDDVQEISIYSKEKPERTYTLKNDGDFTFCLIKPINNTVSFDRVFSNIILPMTALYPEQVLNNNGDNLLIDPDYRISLLFDNEEYCLEISKQDDQKYYIRKDGENTVYSIPSDNVAFLEEDYLDLIGDGIYSCNVAKLSEMTFSDNEAGVDYNFSLSGEATEIEAHIQGHTIAYEEFMPFFKLINSIAMGEETYGAQTDAVPCFTMTLYKKSGGIDLIEFIKKDEAQSFVRVNGVINFTTFNNTPKDIKEYINKFLQ